MKSLKIKNQNGNVKSKILSFSSVIFHFDISILHLKGLSFFILIFAFYILTLPKQASAAVSNLGLVGYWSFNEGTGSYAGDSSGNKNTGTLTNGPTWVDGKRGKALNFDGSNDYVDVPNSSSIGITGDMTLAAWVKVTDFANYNGIVEKSTGNLPNPYDFYLIQTTGVPAFYRGNGSVYGYVNGTSAPTRNTWQFIAVTMSGTTVKHYLNGQTNGSGTLSTTIANGSGSMRIGSRADLIPLMKGAMDEVRVYNRALTPSEVEGLYKSGAAKYTAPTNLGLVGYWSMNENTGTIAGDASGNNNRGILTNGPTWVDGKRGKALNFDGVNDYVNISNPSSLNVANGSVSFWMKTNGVWGTDGTSGGDVASLIGRHDSSGSCEGINILQTPATGVVTAQNKNVAGTCATVSSIVSTGNLKDNNWHHVVYIFSQASGGTNYLYVDGKVDASGTNSTAWTFDGQNLLFGDSTDTFWEEWQGKMDDVRVYNRALSAAEIQALYQADYAKINAPQNNQITNGLVGLWSFNGPDMSGNTAIDSTQGKIATLIGHGLAPGKVGQGLRLAGINTTATFPAVSPTTNVGTFSVWIYPRRFGSGTFANLHRLYGSDLEGCSGLAAYFQSDRTLKYEQWDTSDICGDTSIFYVQTVAPIPTNAWTHIVYVSGASGNAIYVNGAQAAVTYSGGSASTQNFFGLVSYVSELDGILDEVRVYNRALTPAEIKRLYNMGR